MYMFRFHLLKHLDFELYAQIFKAMQVNPKPRHIIRIPYESPPKTPST